MVKEKSLKPNGKINGRNIKRIATRKTWYDNDCIIMYVDGEKYLIDVNELLKITQMIEFESKKARTNLYLTIKSVCGVEV